MCGIAGFVDIRRRLAQAELDRLALMLARSLSHRGPDAQTAWTDAEGGVALGHARLSIVDLSPTGAQPMHSSCGRFVVSYNGEVYNAPELRAELEASGRRFRGHSDTEVMVEGFAVWGVEQTVRRLIGMFAFAVWDRRDRRLTLVRDRLGIKPVYWGVFDNRLMFASELKSLRLVPGWQGVLDRDALAAYMRFGYVPARCSNIRPKAGCASGPTGRCRTSPMPAIATSSMCRTRKPNGCSRTSSRTRSSGVSSPTCCSACSCPAVSIPRPSPPSCSR